MNNTESQPFYIEKEGIGLDEIKIFVEYMIFQRTREFHTPRVDEHGFTTYIPKFEYAPLLDGEIIPDIIFTKKSDFKECEDKFDSVPCRTYGYREDSEGRLPMPLLNYKARIEGYYNYGLKEGNLYCLHRFACELDKMFINNFEVRTWTDGTKRHFEIKNPKHRGSDFYYQDEFLTNNFYN